MGSNRDRRLHLPRTPVFPIYFSGLKNLKKIVLGTKKYAFTRSISGN